MYVYIYIYMCVNHLLRWTLSCEGSQMPSFSHLSAHMQAHTHTHARSVGSAWNTDQSQLCSVCPSWFRNCGPPQHSHAIPIKASKLCACGCGVTWVSCQMVALFFEVGFHFNDCHILEESGRDPPHFTKKKEKKKTNGMHSTCEYMTTCASWCD